MTCGNASPPRRVFNPRSVLRLSASVIILILFIISMILWVLLAEFWPGKRRDDDDEDAEPALA